MNRWIAGTLIAAFLMGGCQSTVKQTKEQASLRWQKTRAQMLYGVAVEHFRAGQLDRAQGKALEALALSPDSADARLLLGKIYIEQGYYALAANELRKTFSQLPRSAEAAYMLGVAQEKCGRLDEAMASYRKAHALDSSRHHAVMAAAEVLVAMGRVQEAQIYVEGYLGLASDEPGMFELAGRLAVMLNDYELGAKDYQQALDLDPKNNCYREALGRAQFHARQYSQAMETLRGVTTDPNYECPAWVHTMLGDCYMAQNRPRDAREAYNAAKELRPSSPGVWVNIAKAALAIGDAPRAILAGQEALRLDSRSLDALMLVGYALVCDKQFERAVVLLAGAAATFPDSGMLQCLLGRAYDAAGQSAKAARCYAAALTLEPDNPLARELLGGAEDAQRALPE